MHEISLGQLILNIAFSWVIGLTPPLLVRFAWIKAPLGNWPAIGACVFFWAFNFMLSAALGGTSKSHAALLLVALASYWILRKPHFPSTADAQVSQRGHGRSRSDSKIAAPTSVNAKANSLVASGPEEAAAVGKAPISGMLDDRVDAHVSAAGERLRTNESLGQDANGASAHERAASDEQYFEMAFEELNAGLAAQGLWAKCFAEADGDENRARARYLSTRSARLKAEHDARIREEAKRIRALEEAAQSVEREKARRAAESEREQRRDAKAWQVAQASLEECLAFLAVAAYSVERTDAGYMVQSAGGLGTPTVLRDLPDVRLFVEKRIAGAA